MFRSAVLLLVVGLAVGLWLGFNPQAHQQTIQKWDSVKSAYLKFMSDANMKVQGLNSHISTSLQTNPGSKSVTPSQPTATEAWKQITTAFDSFWTSMQRFFANVTAKIKSSR
jgi:hypothetical protein